MNYSNLLNQVDELSNTIDVLQLALNNADDSTPAIKGLRILADNCQEMALYACNILSEFEAQHVANTVSEQEFMERNFEFLTREVSGYCREVEEHLEKLGRRRKSQSYFGDKTLIQYLQDVIANHKGGGANQNDVFLYVKYLVINDLYLAGKGETSKLHEYIKREKQQQARINNHKLTSPTLQANDVTAVRGE